MAEIIASVPLRLCGWVRASRFTTTAKTQRICDSSSPILNSEEPKQKIPELGDIKTARTFPSLARRTGWEI
ncbi:hypothetical protein [Methanosaeta sp. UBA458]|uniref:hypothetical protein n=1 Tax=Methanosaeta sp. UBA458 TaxID=1915561 RepID=UPI00257F5B23|nr:hypothetical protein [Methanosaeta sp. UBA458]